MPKSLARPGPGNAHHPGNLSDGNAGLQRLSPTEEGEGYRYTAISVSGNWAF